MAKEKAGKSTSSGRSSSAATAKAPARSSKKTASRSTKKAPAVAKKAKSGKAPVVAKKAKSGKAPVVAKKAKSGKAPAKSATSAKAPTNKKAGSNKKKTSAKAVRPPPPPPPPPLEMRGPLSDAELRKIKTGLTRKDLNHFRNRLIEKRAEIIGDVQSMEGDARNNSGGNLSHIPMHMADVGSDNYEQEFTLGLVESERRLLGEIDEAITRISKGTYGVCVESGKPINRARLDAKLWAKYSIEVVREKERRGEI